MTLRIIVLCLSVLVGGTSLAVSQSTDQSGPQCHDWGEVEEGAVKVMEGEVGWLSCPLFSHPTIYNYTSSQSAGLNLFWYRVPIGQDLEQPIGYSSSSQHLCKERERLWLQPAAVEDTGQYICMLRNKSSCTKIAMRLEVLPRQGAESGRGCQVAVAPRPIIIPLQDDGKLDCPDLQDVLKMADSDSVPSVTWYYNSTCLGRSERCVPALQSCQVYPWGNSDRAMEGNSLVFHLMVERYQGLYYCTVSYTRKGRSLNFTRAVNVTSIYPLSLPQRRPSVVINDVFNIKPETEVHLKCKGTIPYVEGPRDWGWTIDGETVEQLSDPRFTQTNSVLENKLKDLTVESVLVIENFQAEDLNREFNCTAWNQRGSTTRRATLQLEVSLPSVELACGLGVTVALMLVLFVVYHVFWLELLLLYRSWFGTDERYTDNKEYDVYISYARNSEEEHFVLNTLRKVLEQELGYTVCIFDRDSLPGGTITDDTLTFVARSRRLLVVLGGGYGERGSQGLLELRAGLEGMALGGHLRVILVQYGASPPRHHRGGVSELRRARLALALVRWRGEREDGELNSRFWKRLRVELPVRREAGAGGGGGKEKATYRTYQSQSSNSSQTALLSPC